MWPGRVSPGTVPKSKLIGVSDARCGAPKSRPHTGLRRAERSPSVLALFNRGSETSASCHIPGLLLTTRVTTTIFYEAHSMWSRELNAHRKDTEGQNTYADPLPEGGAKDRRGREGEENGRNKGPGRGAVPASPCQVNQLTSFLPQV